MARRGPNFLWIVAGVLVVGAGVFYGIKLTEAPERRAGDVSLQRPELRPPPDKMTLEPSTPRAEPAAREKPPGATITGRLVTPDRTIVTAGRIDLREGTTLGLAGASHLPRFGNHRAESDALGEFALTDVPPTSELTLQIEGEDFAARTAGPFVVQPGALIELGDIVVEPGLLLHGTVLGPDAERVPRARIALHDVFVRNGAGPTLPDPVRVVLTDDDGRYEIPHVPHMMFNLVIEADGYAGAVVEQSILPDRSLSQVTFDVTLARPRLLQGVVIAGPGGVPLANVEIIAQPIGIGLGPGLTRSGPDGTFAFENLFPGHYSIWCDAEGYGRKGQLVTPDEWDEPVELVLSKAARISGFVVDPEGEPVANFDLLARRSSNRNTEGSPVGEFLRFRGTDGSFEIGDLEWGWYVFEVWSKGYAVTRSEPLRIKRGENHSGLVITMQLGASISGRLVDDLGTPIAGARISLHSNRLPEVEFLRTGEPNVVWMGSVNSARDGTFLMPDVTAKVYQVQFDHSAYPIVRRNDVAVLAGRTTALGDVVLPRPGSLQGIVVDRSGTPQADATVRVHGESGSREVHTNGQGRYSVDRLAPGRYLVQATAAHPTMQEVTASIHAEIERVLAEHNSGIDERIDIAAGQQAEFVVTLD